MRTACFVLIVLFLTAASAAAQNHDLQTAGQVAVHSKPGLTAATSSTAWGPVPSMKGSVTLPKGGNLQITISADAKVTGGSDPSLYVRVKVNGVVLTPTTTRLVRGARGRRSASITFFKSALPAGVHDVHTEWSVSSGATATAYARSMILRFATADSPWLRLSQVQGTSASALAGSWANMPGMATVVDLPWDGRLTVNVSGEFLSFTAGKLALVRALVDGKSYQDTVVCGDASEGTRSYTFTTPKLLRGKRSVVIQWWRDDTSMVLFPLLNVSAVSEAVNYKTGFLHQAYSGAEIKLSSTSWSNLSNVGGNIWVPSRTDVAIRVSTESRTATSSTSMLRVRFDGNTADPGEVALSTGSSSWGAHDMLFVVRNVERGWHSIAVDWRMAAANTTGSMGGYSLAATAVSGQRPLLVAAMESVRPSGYKYGGTFASSVVEVKNNQRVFRSYCADNLFRAKPGVADWFLEQSRGHMYVVEAGLIGPGLKKFNEQYYREQVLNPFTAMKHEALLHADQSFDFSLYDRNGDGRVTTDELYAVVVLYQDTPWGEVRSLPAIASNDGVTIDFTAGIATVYTPDFSTRDELGLFDHELSHLLLNAGDMYESAYDPTAPGPYSIMDQAGYNGHLDPLHKLKSRWYEAYGQTQDRYLTITPVANGGSLVKLDDPKSHSGEYFLLENRAGLGYNAALPAQGLAIWHIDENRLPDWRTAVEIEPAGGYTNPNRYENYLFRGTAPRFNPANDFFDDSSKIKSRWHDSQKSGIGVWAIERLPGSTGNLQVFVDVPGPGVLVELDGSRYNVAPDGTAVVGIRLVNTDFTADAFDVTVSVSSGTASWGYQRHSLAGYQQKIVWVTLKPNLASCTVSVKAKGSLSGVSTTDTAEVRAPLRLLGAPQPGVKVTLECNLPAQKGKSYAMGAAFGHTPGISLGAAGTLPLSADSLFFAHDKLPHIFQNFRGKLSNTGWAQAFVAVPADTRLKGLDLYCAFVTYGAMITDISNAVAVKIR